MNLATPTTQEVSDTIVSQLEASLDQTLPFLPKSFLRVLAKVTAGAFILNYKYAGFIFLQLFVQHATMEETVINGKRIRPLLEWGRLIGEPDPEPAIRAELLVSVDVLNQTGFLKAQTAAVRTESGVIYEVVAPRLLDAANVHVTIRAVSDQDGGDGSGAIGNLQAGDIVSFANPIPNVVREVTVLSQSVTGADGESVDSYRARVIKRFQAKPQGGAYADYRDWGAEVPGIVNVYPYTGDPGEVNIFVEASEASSGSVDGIPTQPQLDAVKATIELDDAGLAARRPANALVNTLPIIRTAFGMRVHALDPDTPDTRAAIEQGADEYFRSAEPFIVGLSVLPRKDRITQAALSGIVDTIVSAAGGTVSSVELTENGGTITARSLDDGEKAKLGSPTYLVT